MHNHRASASHSTNCSRIRMSGCVASLHAALPSASSRQSCSGQERSCSTDKLSADVPHLAALSASAIRPDCIRSASAMAMRLCCAADRPTRCGTLQSRYCCNTRPTLRLKVIRNGGASDVSTLAPIGAASTELIATTAAAEEGRKEGKLRPRVAERRREGWRSEAAGAHTQRRESEVQQRGTDGSAVKSEQQTSDAASRLSRAILGLFAAAKSRSSGNGAA